MTDTECEGAWTGEDPGPIIQISTYGFVLVAHPSVPAKMVRELIAVARAKPKGITFVSTGVGSNFHLAGELFKIRAKVDMWHVPYKGSPPAIIDLIAGRADTMFMRFRHCWNTSARAFPRWRHRAGRNPLLPGAYIAERASGYEMGDRHGSSHPPHAARILVRLNAASRRSSTAGR